MSARRAAACALALALASGCRAHKSGDASPARPVVLAPVEERDVEEHVAATGQILAKQRAEVAAQVPGEVTAIAIDEGQPASEGAVVIEIDPERRALDLDRARARLSESGAALLDAQRQHRRLHTLAARNVVSKAQLEQADSALEAARSRIQALQADLGAAERAARDSRVAARFAGVIGRRFVSRGEFVQPGQKLFELVSLDPVEVEFNLPEADAARLQLGLPLDVSVAPYPGELFHAQVSMVSPVIDERTRTLRVKALLANADGRLRPGLFARADLGIEKHENVLLISEEALLQRADGKVVFRAVDGGTRAERRVVEIGAIKGGLVEIRSGLAAGDIVIVRGHSTLVDGAVIAARNPDGSRVLPASTPSSPP
ncbi:MAG TPA: efflux RND transporter periplasmic adaptor subunit [Myxococcota bacterium]|nr:efflux RND transporter periplasmic adaptor subunit [Myxococcota bacterium]